MRRVLLAIAAAAAVISTGFSICAGEDASPGKVIAYYFHGSFRCPTCHKLEQYAKEAVETNFKDRIASGTLEFKVVNIEEKGNEHFVNDYNLYTKALVITLIKDGRELKSRNLTKIWDYVGNKQEYFEYVTGEINDFLKGS